MLVVGAPVAFREEPRIRRPLPGERDVLAPQLEDLVDAVVNVDAALA